MKKDNIPDIESATIALAKGLVGCLPLVVAMASLLTELIAAVPMENRRTKWLE